MRRTVMLLGCICFIVLTISLISKSLEAIPFARSTTEVDYGQLSGHREARMYPLSQRVSAVYDNFWGTQSRNVVLSELSKRCQRTEFRSEIYLDCARIYGGLTTVMSIIKSCVRLAIETRMNLIVPVISRRDDSDLSSLHASDNDISDLLRHEQTSIVEYGSYFDEGHLVDKLGAACPSMKLLTREKDKSPAKPFAYQAFIRIEEAPSFTLGPYAGRTEQNWTAWIDEAISGVITGLPEKPIPPHDNASVSSIAPLTFFDVTSDETGADLRLWNDIELLLSFPKPVRMLAVALLDQLRDGNGTLRPYLGVHFRSEADTTSAGFATAEEQIARIMESAGLAWDKYGYSRDRAEKLIFLACGDQDRIAQFEKHARQSGWKVIDKYSIYKSIAKDLVSSMDEYGEVAADLMKLSFDQQAGIDLSIMVMCDFFIGIFNSAFSVTVAHARSVNGRYKGNALQNWEDPDARSGRSSLSLDDPKAAYQCCL